MKRETRNAHNNVFNLISLRLATHNQKINCNEIFIQKLLNAGRLQHSNQGGIKNANETNMKV
jgi:hypothetical protein